MKRSESCLFFVLDKDNDDHDNRYGGTADQASGAIDEDVLRTSLASIGIRCNDEHLGRLCHDVLCLEGGGGGGEEEEEGNDHHSNHQLLLLKVNDVIEGLQMITDTDHSSNINGRPA